jgi:type IV pilus assembly protein PilM
MVSWLSMNRCGPIGVDLGSSTVKLLQFDTARNRLVAAGRWDLPLGKPASAEERDAQWVDALARSRHGRPFQGRDAVLCLGARDLFVQNLRVAKLPGDALEKTVHQEAAGRLPFPAAEAEVRFLEAGDVRHGESVKREVIVLACHRPVVDRLLAVVERAGLRPVGVDVEPLALLRCYVKQYRREDDKHQRTLYVHIGATSTAVVIAHGEEPLFVKYIDVGGRHLDEAVAQHLRMAAPEAAALRRHNGDRRADQQDPEVAQSVAESVRPVLDRLVHELSLCQRYHSVTFRGQPLARIVLGGGEATPALAELVQQRLEVRTELGEPLRTYDAPAHLGRKAQWDIAAGLALRESAP